MAKLATSVFQINLVTYLPTSAQLDMLEQAACTLLDTFPPEQRDSFGIFEVGFYLHNPVTNGGVPEAFQMSIDAAKQRKPYYILFGKQSDASGLLTRIWVDLELPVGGEFSCLNLISPSQAMRSDLEFNYQYQVNTEYTNLGASPSVYATAISTTLDSLTARVHEIKECCDNQQKGASGCEACVLDSKQFSSRLLSDNFSKASFSILEKLGQVSVQNQIVNYGVGDGVKYFLLDTALSSVKVYLNTKYPGLTVKIFPFTYDHNCTDYSDIVEQWENDNSDIKILIGAVKNGINSGGIFWRSASQEVSLAEMPSFQIDTIYYFNKDGKFFKKEKGVGGPKGIWLDKYGPGKNLEFVFADPLITPRTLTTNIIPEESPFDQYIGTDEPLTNRLVLMDKDVIKSHLIKGTAFDYHVFPPWTLYNQSSGWEAPFDFSTKSDLYDKQNILFLTIVGDKTVAHNFRNFGNFLWGASTYVMGMWEWLALGGAHLNNLNTETNSSWDSPDDQWSIRLGREFAKRYNWKTIHGGKANTFRN